MGGIKEKCRWSENPEKRCHLEDLGIGGSIVLEWTERRNKQRREEKEGNVEREV
jgi:hypothetical protein